VSGSPAAYVQQYGASLLDGVTLVTQARSAGVIEDLTPPGFVGSASAVGVSGGYGESLVSGGSVGYGESVVSGGSLGYGGAVGGGWSGGVVGGGGLVSGLADAAFSTLDTNHDGSLDQAEFSSLVGGGLGGGVGVGYGGGVGGGSSYSYSSSSEVAY